jgi:hypothetical protein
LFSDLSLIEQLPLDRLAPADLSRGVGRVGGAACD